MKEYGVIWQKEDVQNLLGVLGVDGAGVISRTAPSLEGMMAVIVLKEESSV